MGSEITIARDLYEALVYAYSKAVSHIEYLERRIKEQPPHPIEVASSPKDLLDEITQLRMINRAQEQRIAVLTHRLNAITIRAK